MPALSGSMETGVVAKWRIAVGDTVAEGQIIADIEADKGVLEYESPEAGRVVRLLAAEGVDEVPVGAPILELAAIY
jgi:pyruvate dehydrogenase E2 component (dihydrolipoamide acetyltransferase)